MFNTITFTCYTPCLNMTIILLGNQGFEIPFHFESLSEYSFKKYV